MRYPDNSIEHREDCQDFNVRRLYVKDYDDKGRQIFVPYGITCIGCGVMKIEKFDRNLPPTLRQRYDKYTEEQHAKFKVIDAEYSAKVRAMETEEDEFENYEVSWAIYEEWQNKLIEAGMERRDSWYHKWDYMTGVFEDYKEYKVAD
jgi:hypothetical protein